jgi:hypothetical protein
MVYYAFNLMRCLRPDAQKWTWNGFRTAVDSSGSDEQESRFGKRDARRGN